MKMPAQHMEKEHAPTASRVSREPEPAARVNDPAALRRAVAAPLAARPEAVLGLQRMYGNRAVGRMLSGAAPHGVIQRVMAYRVEGSITSPKIMTDGEKYFGLSPAARAEGISISFKSDEHAEYYTGQKGTGLKITMEIKDELYNAARAKIDGETPPSPYNKLSKPSPCSDPIMKKLSGSEKDVLTFSKDWCPYLAEAIKLYNVEILGEAEEEERLGGAFVVVAKLDDTWYRMSKEQAESMDLKVWVSEARAQLRGMEYEDL